MQNNNILNQSINSETSENNNKQTDEESINNDNKQNKIKIKTYLNLWKYALK